MVKRIGNWYEVELDGQKYQVLIQKDKGSVECQPDTLIIFKENMTESLSNFEEEVYEKIFKIMEENDYTFEVYP